MTKYYLLTGMAVCCVVYGLAAWRTKRKQLGQVPIIPYFYWQFFAMIIFIILSANLVSDLTGLVWDSPFGGRR